MSAHNPLWSGPNEEWPWMIVCGSGPSLAEIDPFEPGCPILAVSTAIRWIPRPHAWATLDGCQKPHGLQGELAVNDPLVIKVLPNALGLDKLASAPSCRWFDHRSGPDRKFLDGTKVLFSVLNRSSMFAVQWACMIQNCRNLIFAGFDLVTDKHRPYCYDAVVKDDVAGRSNTKHNQELEWLKRWNDIALARGVRFLSWTPRSRINEFMEPYRGRG